VRYVFLCALPVLLGTLAGFGEPLGVGDSIQAAIDAAPEGATLELGPGTWTANLRIGKSITLKGAGAGESVIRGAVPGMPVILVSGDDVTVRLVGITVAGAVGEACAGGTRDLCPHGILARAGARVEITDCEVVDNAGCGLFVAGRAEALVAESSFARNGRAGVWAHDESKLTLIGVEIVGNPYGLIAASRAHVTARDSRIADNGHDGVLIADGARVYLWDNEITGNGRVGLCLDVPGCYRTEREFTGIVRGAGNTIPRGEKEGANRVAAYCPRGLAPLRTRLGGIYPPLSPDELLADFPGPIPAFGSPEAPVTMVEFSDFSCPYCARFAVEVLPDLRRAYIDTGRLRLLFLPLAAHGEASRKEAEAALCAAAQGIFGAFHDAMFAYSHAGKLPREFDPEFVRPLVAEAGGDPGEFAACLAAGTYAEAVDEIGRLAGILGVRGTPTFFVGNWAIPGAYRYEVFSGVIEMVLREER